MMETCAGEARLRGTLACRPASTTPVTCGPSCTRNGSVNPHRWLDPAVVNSVQS
jgi:hypothetical protein